jgi:hypothetical protein
VGIEIHKLEVVWLQTAPATRHEPRCGFHIGKRADHRADTVFGGRCAPPSLMVRNLVFGIEPDILCVLQVHYQMLVPYQTSHIAFHHSSGK